MPEHTLADRWILARLAHVRREVNRLFEAYQFAEAGRQLYEFVWGEYADWYLEGLQAADGQRPAAAGCGAVRAGLAHDAELW